MGMGQSRRCYQCKAIVGWNANLCGHCEYREGRTRPRSKDDHLEQKISLWRMWPSKQRPKTTDQDSRTY